MTAVPADPYRLDRFAHAQEGVYARVLAELRNGHKESHWMWFIFPQAQGLGRSQQSRTYAIRSLDEARAYLKHPLLGSRLRERTDLVLHSDNFLAYLIFGMTDSKKLRSSMTLFDFADGTPDNPFAAVLRRYFDGTPDANTERLLTAIAGGSRAP